MTLKKALIVIAVLILLYLAAPAVHINSTDAGGLSNSTPAAPTTVLPPETTTTTIDLSFLNTTTTVSTTVPKQRQNNTNTASVPEYRNDNTDRWDRLAQCETGGNWSANTGNGYGGGLQFAHKSSWSTWKSFGGQEFAPHPWEASREQQIIVAERVLKTSGWRAWPGCSKRFGWI